MKQALINYMQNEKYDTFFTPEEAIKPILKYIPKNAIIWECCDDTGTSNITKKLRALGHKVITTGMKENFLTFKPDFDFDIIITNPPYSLKNEFIEKCYQYEKPFLLLLPITALEGIERGKMFREKGISVIVLDKRINYIEGKSIYFNTSWFSYKIIKENTLIFEEV